MLPSIAPTVALCGSRTRGAHCTSSPTRRGISSNSVGIKNVSTLVSRGDVSVQVTFAVDRSARLSSAHSVPSSVLLSPPPCKSDASATPNIRKRKRADDVANGASSAAVADGHQTPDENLRVDGLRLQRRRHTHYRIVVEEVCIPLKKFENSRQLVSVKSDCLRAHFQVATNPKARILHRDISMGPNMLMLPKTAHGSQDRPSSITWTGILSDWEMSKPMDDQQAASNAPQADQIGTYQFMSVNSLQRPSQPVAVPDELESFFHVLLYFAVPFLRSMCDTPSAWIDNYFHNYSGSDSEHTHACGQKSVTIEVTGKLRTLSPLGLLRFNSPLDTIFAEMLPCFKARYGLELRARENGRPAAAYP
ncbi:hypothetical protein LXA43DRAFT_648693 [Ganoderma leucocontextum]|nr:hypothetical protein LXA43DRAFT_648693 [Ganoderma leucocontextum]